MGYLNQSTKMGTWKQRKLKKGLHGKQESGKKKGLVPPAWARYCAKAGKGYKHPDYSRWSSLCDGGKVKWNKGA